MTLKEHYPDALVLDAGDCFQGTYWYTLLKWNVTQYFINMLPNDAHVRFLIRKYNYCTKKDTHKITIDFTVLKKTYPIRLLTTFKVDFSITRKNIYKLN